MSVITLLQPFNLDTTKDYTFTTVTANIKTDHLLYANGSPYVFTSSAGGINTQIQFNDNGDFAGNINLTFDKTTGKLTTSLVGGTLTTNAQPNITSTGTLVNLVVSGNVTFSTSPSVSVYLGNEAKANYFNGQGNLLSNLQASNIVGTIANANYAAYAGNIITAAQPNITSVGTLSNLTVTGNITGGNANLGNAVRANYFIGDGSQLTGVAATTFISGTSNINSPVANGNINVSVGGVSNVLVVSNTGIIVTSNITSGNANLGNLATANYFSGTLTTAAQPNITSVGTLSNLTVTSNITSGNANLGNAVTANYFIGSGNNLSNIQAANISGTVANANYAAYAGNVVTAAQPNITSVGTLTSLTAGDTTITGNLTVTGTTITANVTTLNVKDPIIEQGGTSTGAALTTDDGKERGQLLHYYNGKAIDAFMGWMNSNAEFTFASNVSVSNNSVTINTLGNIKAGNANLGNLATANYFSGDGSLLSNIPVSTSLANGTSNILVAANSNVTMSVGGTSNVLTVTSTGANISGTANITGNLSATNANLGNAVRANYFIGSGNNLSNIQGANVSGTVANANYAAYAGNAYSVTGSNVTGTVANATYAVNAGNAYAVAGANVTGTVANATIASTAYAVAGANVSGTVANANYAAYAGNVVTAAQPNITSLGTLANLAVTDNVDFDGAAISLGNLSNITINGGLPDYAIKTDGYGNLFWSPAAPVTGSNTQIQFNDNGNSGATANLTFNYVTKTLTVDKIVSNGSQLTSLTGANVTGTVANATYAITAGTAYAVAGANVSGTVSSATSATSATTAGTVTTAAQPNITSVGTLTSLAVTGNITSGNADLGALVTAYSATIPNITASGNIAFSGPNVSLGNISNLHIPGGTSGYVLRTDGAGNLSWVSSTAGLGNANVGGSSTQIQYNDGTNLAGSANLTFDASTKTLSVDKINVNGNLTSANANLGNAARANYFIGSGNNLSNIQGPNVIGEVANANYADFAGTVLTAAQPNITSVGTLTSLAITGNLTSGNANLGNLVTANYFSGSGNNLSNIQAANITGTVANANYATYAGAADTSTTAGTVTTAAQPNITSVGNLLTLNITGGSGLKVDNQTATVNFANTGNVTLGSVSNLHITGGSSDYVLRTDGAGNLTWTQQASYGSLVYVDTFTGTGSQTAFTLSQTPVDENYTMVNINGVTQLKSSYTVSGSTLTLSEAPPNGIAIEVTIITSQAVAGGITYTISGSNVVGEVASATTANYASYAGNIITAAQPNITSVGTLTSLAVTGNISGGNLTSGNANLGNAVRANYFIGSGNLLSNIQAANITGTVSTATSATTAATVTTAAQPNITSVGTLTSLAITGNLSSGNAILGNAVRGNYFIGSGNNLSNIQAANVAGEVANATYATTSGSTLTAATVTNGAQPNITCVGTLSNVTVSGVITPSVGSGTNGIIWPANPGGGAADQASIKYYVVSGEQTRLELSVADNNAIDARRDDLYFTSSGYTVVNNSTDATSTTDAPFQVTGGAGIAKTLYVGSNVVSGNANLGNLASSNYFSGNGYYLSSIRGANVSGTVPSATSATSATTAGTVTTAAQPNITTVGTLTFLAVTGSVTAGNVYANSGTVKGSLLTGTLTTASQPNITSLGSLSSLIVSGTTNLGSISNVTITGGSSGDILQTDGAGSLSWNSISSASGVPNWISAGSIYIDAYDIGSFNGTAPTKPYSPEQDNMSYRQIGPKEWEVIMTYRNSSSTGGSSGNGDYIFTLPNSLYFDTSLPFQQPFTGYNNNSTWSWLREITPTGQGTLSNSGTGAHLNLAIYDGHRFRILATQETIGGIKAWGSAFFGITNSTLGLKFRFTFTST